MNTDSILKVLNGERREFVRQVASLANPWMLCGVVENVEAQGVSYLQQLALESLRHKRKLGSVAKETQVAARFSILVKDQTSTLGELVILP